MIQHLKSWPRYFDAILAGTKKHDIRKMDRRFEIGDIIMLEEFDPKTSNYTGRKLKAKITWISSSDEPCSIAEDALSSDFCVLSLEVQYQGIV
jgi:hypothetical protein